MVSANALSPVTSTLSSPSLGTFLLLPWKRGEIKEPESHPDTLMVVLLIDGVGWTPGEMKGYRIQILALTLAGDGVHRACALPLRTLFPFSELDMIIALTGTS